MKKWSVSLLNNKFSVQNYTVSYYQLAAEYGKGNVLQRCYVFLTNKSLHDYLPAINIAEAELLNQTTRIGKCKVKVIVPVICQGIRQRK